MKFVVDAEDAVVIERLYQVESGALFTLLTSFDNAKTSGLPPEIYMKISSTPEGHVAVRISDGTTRRYTGLHAHEKVVRLEGHVVVKKTW